MKIQKVLFSPGTAGFFFDDQQAIRKGLEQDGFIYRGKAVIPGFNSVRQAAESISIILVLEDGTTACGDCTAVQYSGAGGRDPLFLSREYIPFLIEHIKPRLEGLELGNFREAANYFDRLTIEGERIHTALRYGLSQALLAAEAAACKKLMVEIICEQWDLPVNPERVPLFGQSGDDRYIIVDKMILKGVDALPHGLFNNVESKLGAKGEKLLQYVEWLVKRIYNLRQSDSYLPDLHFDVYGTVGMLFGNDIDLIADYLVQLEKVCGKLALYVECPVIMDNKEAEIECMGKIRRRLRQAGSGVKIVADEWCNTFEDIVEFTDAECCDMIQIKTPDLGGVHNTIESILYCKGKVETYQGGSCTETDISARISTHVAMAARPQRMLVKPGMGFDEGFTIVNNEMNRIGTILAHKHRSDI